ncbi:MAG: hypothetical protein VX346_28500 [Planctomycetota bacterium]|nr:hypothetical protein [Planctomycetota bacterium]
MSRRSVPNSRNRGRLRRPSTRLTIITETKRPRATNHAACGSPPQGDHKEAWIEFELPAEEPLGTLLVWNWNDGPETGRRVDRMTVQTSRNTTTAGQFGAVEYDVTHTTLRLPDISLTAERAPDVSFSFPPGTRSRYLRLAGMITP